ncbi:beta-1,4-glucuronyltransferase 1-like [Diadema setosum]|uniref:beta-1,4-glucuronyltransferase 1-like n=1 Tax=Diadema setosum TaxID=31175 RepID=UPI003B3A9EC7
MRCTLMQYTICALVIILVFLQLIHLTMISWLDNRTQNGLQSGAREFAPKKSANSSHSHQYRTKHRYINLPAPKLNTYGSYQIFYDLSRVYSKVRPLNRRDVTLITHCSMNNMLHLPELVERWKGPVSVAVFGSLPDIPSIVSYIFSLQECYLGIRRNVTFHLVHPLSSFSKEAEVYGAKTNKRSISVPMVQCDKLIDSIKSSSENVRNYAQNGVSYPTNLLRNVGRTHALTDYHFVLDVDMLPSCGLRENFLQFVQGSSSLWLDQDMVQQMVFVLPAFEVDVRAVHRLPCNKRELMVEFGKDTVRQFYVKQCPYCQNHTDYLRWTSLQSFTGQLGVAYTVEWKPLWEPFYISRSDVPLYDERFRQYGYNRISQVCELNVAGYNFAVLDRAFVIHKGFKEKTEFHQQKDTENRDNRHLFLQFHAELETKYPESKRHCL